VTPRVAVLDYGSGNLHSVSRALTHVGAEVDVTSDPAVLAAAGALLVPGVGHFGACMRALRSRGLDEEVRAFVRSGRPLFGVCVGMQILFDGSEEDDADGLAILPGRIRRLPTSVRVPHIGWNNVEWSEDVHPYLKGIGSDDFFYFVHSYARTPCDETIGITVHGWGFSSAVSHDNVFATQFHPEKSGEAGLQLYENFVREVAA
jgi:imidazole glycerol-phosphate synthase subunit HisH